MDDRPTYPSYNGMSRIAMDHFGVPVVATVITLTISTVIGGFALMFCGIGGILFALVGVPIWLFFRMICLTDDQAIAILLLELLALLSWRKSTLFGKTYTLVPNHYGRNVQDFKRYLKDLKD